MKSSLVEMLRRNADKDVKITIEAEIAASTYISAALLFEWIDGLDRAIDVKNQAEDRASKFIARAHAADDFSGQVDQLNEQLRYVRSVNEREQAELRRRVEKAEAEDEVGRLGS